MIRYRKKPTYLPREQCPQAAHERMVLQQPLANFTAEGVFEPEAALLKKMNETGAVFMMGQNPNLPLMPEKPRLLDFFHYRFCDIASGTCCRARTLALKAGHSEKVVLACLLHDISTALPPRRPRLLGRADDRALCGRGGRLGGAEPPGAALLRRRGGGLSSTRMPTTSSSGRTTSQPEYLCKAYEEARNHHWYMTSRLITIYDIYSFEEGVEVDPDDFTDIIGRHFRQPKEGLGFDGSPVAHMWRTMIWPNNFL